MFIAFAFALAAVGFLLGRRRGRARPHAPVPVLRAGAGLLAAAFALIPLGGLLRADALGWLGGLSLMLLLPTLGPFLAGYAVGWSLGARRLPLPRPWTTADLGTERPARPPLDAAALVQRAAHDPTVGALLAVAGVGAGFLVAIGAGYHLNGRTGPALLGQLLVPGLVLAMAVIGAAGWRWHRRRGLAPAPRHGRR